MPRSALTDFFKALASQLIVLHHLCLYSPMADWLAEAWPRLIDFIVEDGRLVVQSFLVISGFLAAQSLHKRSDYPLLALVWQRYIRLAPPLVFALLLVMACTAVVGSDLAGRAWLSPLPSGSVLLAHLLLLQDLLDIPSMLAGAWYVAIDLQLFALFVALLVAVNRWAGWAADTVVPALLALATAASIWVFSRVPGLDVWGIYFLSAYGLGALAAWSAYSPTAKWLWWLSVALLLVDYLLEPRDRPLWALATALALYAGSHIAWDPRSGLLGQLVRSLSTWSYGIFVCHFAVIILVSGLWMRFHFSGVNAALMAFGLVILASVSLGALVQAGSDRLLRWFNSGAPASRLRDERA